MSERVGGAREGRRRRLAHRRGHARPGGGGEDVKSEINVTPLVDVVLVLLIIFMVVTPMLARGVKVELPETAHHEKKPDTGEQIIVSVTEAGAVFVDATPTTLETLPETIRREVAKQGPESGARGIHVKADRRLTFGEVKRVLQKIHQAGAPQLGLGTEEQKAGSN